MEAVLSFRNKLNNCSSMLEKIALLKGEKIQSDEHARNNNIFFKIGPLHISISYFFFSFPAIVKRLSFFYKLSKVFSNPFRYVIIKDMKNQCTKDLLSKRI